MTDIARTRTERIAYRRRVRQQTRAWIEGRSLHNNVDNECCPDFSCCEPKLFVADKSEREAYANKRGDL